MEDSDRSRARRTVEEIVASDAMMRQFGIVVEDADVGRVVLSMMLTPNMANTHGIAHGGALFTLADSAFGCAAATGAVPHLANHCHISFLAPGPLGEQVYATAEERFREGRNGMYDVSVRRADGSVIAELRGWSRELPAGMRRQGTD